MIRRTNILEEDISIPKKIWFLWLQGLSRAPDIVRSCYQSWEKHNPEWELNILDENNLEYYVNIKSIVCDNYSTITPQALSDIVRINLLNKYGGVWVDATCYCCKPLNSWLPQYSTAGFFAFDLFKPGKDRLISSF